MCKCSGPHSVAGWCLFVMCVGRLSSRLVLVCDVCRKAFKQDGVVMFVVRLLTWLVFVMCVGGFQAGWCL